MKRLRKSRTGKGFRCGAGLLLAALLFSACGLTPEAKEARFLEAGRKYMVKKDYTRAVIEFQNAARAKKGDGEPYYQLGLAFLAMGDHESGYNALKKAVDLKHEGAKIRLASLLATRGDVSGKQRAEALARDVLTVKPNDPDALNALAIAEWNLGDKGNAEMDLLKVLNSAPKDLQALLNLAKIKYFQSDRAGAEEIIKKAAAANPQAAQPALALAELYTLAGKSEAAEEQYRRAVQIDPKNELALLSLASLYVQTNRPDQAEQVYKQISALPDQKYLTMHGTFLFQSGKREQAIAEFEKLVKDNPSDRTARTSLIEAYFATRRLPDAEKLLTAALRKNDKDVDALLQRSRMHLMAGNYADAERDVGQVLHFQRDSSAAHYVMSKIHQGRGAGLSQRQELVEAVRLNPYALPFRLELARLFLDNKVPASALATLDEASDAQKTLVPFIVLRNWALMSAGENAKAGHEVALALAQARTPELLLQDAILKLGEKRYGDVRALLHESLAKRPDDVRALQILVYSYAAQKQLPAAVNEVRQYAAQRPKSAPTQYFLGNLLFQTGDQVHARQAFAAAKSADPNYVAADLSLAQLDLTQAKWEDARKQLDTILSAKKENPQAWLWLGMLEETNGNHKAALAAFRKVIEIDPNNAVALNNVASLLAENENKPDEALKYAEKAVELSPESADFEDTLGWVLYRKGLWDVAIKHLERALSKKSEVRIQYHLAMAYLKGGDEKRGRASFEAALAKNPNIAEAKWAQQLFQKTSGGEKR